MSDRKYKMIVHISIGFLLLLAVPLLESLVLLQMSSNNCRHITVDNKIRITYWISIGVYLFSILILILLLINNSVSNETGSRIRALKRREEIRRFLKKVVGNNDVCMGKVRDACYMKVKDIYNGFDNIRYTPFHTYEIYVVLNICCFTFDRDLEVKRSNNNDKRTSRSNGIDMKGKYRAYKEKRKSTLNRKVRNREEKCEFCEESYGDREVLIILEECNHTCHVSCAYKHMMNNNECVSSGCLVNMRASLRMQVLK